MASAAGGILALSVSHSLDRFPLLPLMLHLPPARGRWHEVPEGEQGGTAQAVTERASPLKRRTFFAFSPKTQLSCKKSYNFFLKKAVFPLTALL